VFLDLRKPVRAADQDIRKAFVVAQKHVVLRLELLDEVLLQQQRLGFGPRRQEHHRRGFPDHPGDARAVSGGLGVGRHPLFQRPRLADIEHSALRIEHAVDTRRVVELTEVIPDHLMAGFGGILHVVGHVLSLFSILPAAAMEPGRFQGTRNPLMMWITLRRNLGLHDFFFVFGPLLRIA
jgi:hypothetical protein